MGDAAAGVMLHAGILTAYQKGVARLAETQGIERLGAGPTAEGRAGAVLFATDAATFERTPHLAEEVFGAAGLLVRHSGWDALAPLLRGLEGQLTITVHMTEADEPLFARLLPSSGDQGRTNSGERLAHGRGGEPRDGAWRPVPGDLRQRARPRSAPFPSGGFCGPVCYQNLAAALLPDPVADANPWAAMAPDGWDDDATGGVTAVWCDRAAATDQAVRRRRPLTSACG